MQHAVFKHTCLVFSVITVVCSMQCTAVVNYEWALFEQECAVFCIKWKCAVCCVKHKMCKIQAKVFSVQT